MGNPEGAQAGEESGHCLSLLLGICIRVRRTGDGQNADRRRGGRGSVVIGGKYAMPDYWGRVLRKDRIEAAKVMRAAACAHLAERNWGVLSQGERQRVLIARALMARPAVLILDEPCAGLDPVGREQFLGFMQRLASRKVAGKNSPTRLFVTHHVEEIVPALTHALLLREGRVTATGPVQKILTSKNLTHTFASLLRLRRRNGRWALH